MPGKRASYCAKEKLKIVEYASKNGIRAAGRKFEISECNVRRWKAMKSTLLTMNEDKLANRGDKPHFEEIEKELVTWLAEETKNGFYHTTGEIRMKALKLAKAKGGIDNFKASSSWVTNIKKRLKNPKPRKGTSCKSGKAHTVEFKLQVMKHAESRGKPAACKKFGISVGTITSWNRLKDRLIKNKTAEQKLEKELSDLIVEERKKGVYLSAAQIRSKAMTLAKSKRCLGQIKVTKNWVTSFLQRQRGCDPLVRKAYTAEYKLRVVDFAEGHGIPETVQEFGINEKNVRTWMKFKDDLLFMDKGKQANRGQVPNFPEIEKKAIDWLARQRKEGYSVSSAELRMKALAFANDDGVMDKFKATATWAYRFLKKTGNQNLHMQNETFGKKDLTKPFKCEICGLVIYHRIDLHKHLKFHTGDEPPACGVCGKILNHRGQVGIHVKFHMTEKPFQCDVCGKGFAIRTHLAAHIRIHTGEKPYQCSSCGKRFTESGHLQKHMQCHTGYRPHQCDVCGKAFSQRGPMLKHLKTHKLMEKGILPGHLIRTIISTSEKTQTHKNK